MKKLMKWLAIVVGALIVLVIAALLIIPMFVDIQKYKPEIEKRVSQATGRPCTLGGDLHLSLFPWAGVSLSDLHLGNPPGFKEKDFLTVKSFEVRVKLLPLLSKDIQVKRFILEEPRIVLEKNKEGRANWQGLGKAAPEVAAKRPKEKAPEPKPEEGLPIKTLTVGEFAVTEGSALWIDQIKGERKEISDVNVRLKDVSLDRPIHLAFSARLDGKPLSLEGDVGPIGKDPGKGTISLNLSIKALEQLDMSLKGKVVDAVSRSAFDLAVAVSPFSPRKLVEALGEKFPVATADPEALNRVAFKAKLSGNPQAVSVSDGLLELDKSKLTFSVKAKDFSKPDVAFDLKLDQIDLDRYMPPPSEKKAAEEKKPAPKAKKTDYAPLRRAVLDGTIRVGQLKVRGAKIQDLEMKVSGKNGRFNIDPMTARLYEGDMVVKGVLDVQQDSPRSTVDLDAKKIQVGPLLQDVMQKDVLEGTVKATVALRMAGDEPDRIKKALNGKGDVLFNDGAIKGIDLAGMVRNVKAAFGLAEKGGQRPRTDFSELHAPFTITNGVVNTPKTAMISPLLRVMASGDANLVKETLDFRVEPKAVSTLKGQGDKMERAGIMVPVIVGGTFSKPTFRPDLEGMLKQRIEKELPVPTDLKKMIPGAEKEKEEPKGAEEKVKGLLKGLPFGK